MITAFAEYEVCTRILHSLSWKHDRSWGQSMRSTCVKGTATLTDTIPRGIFHISVPPLVCFNTTVSS